MTASTVASGLTPADRVLLRSVFAWARANGWRPVQTIRNDREWAQIEPELGPNVNVRRPNYGDNGEDNYGPIGVSVAFFDEGRYRVASVPKVTVREAVDVIVALGILPAHLSSQYDAGHADGYGQGRDDEAAGV